MFTKIFCYPEWLVILYGLIMTYLGFMLRSILAKRKKKKGEK